MEEKKKSRWKDVLRLVIFLGIGVFFIYWFLLKLDPEQKAAIWQSFREADYWWVAVAMLCSLLSHVARALRWQLLFHPIGYRPRLNNTFGSVLVAYLANLAFPRAGEVMRCATMRTSENIPMEKSLGTVVTERAVDIICWIVLLVVAVAMNTSMLSEVVVDQDTQMTVRMWMEQKGLSILSNYFIFILIAFFVALYFLFRLTRKWWSHIAWMMKVRSFLVGIWQGVVSIKDLPHPIRYVVWTIIMWVAYFLGTYSCILALPFLSHAGSGAAFSVLIFGTIAFMVSQGGLGSYPLITAGILVLYGVSYTQGLAGGWIGWFLQTTVSIGFGLLSLVAASFYKKKDSANPIPADENLSSSK
jgi:uncharacterized protein (TIRG00374 family)